MSLSSADSDSSIHQGLDRKRLKTLQKRFMALNAARLQRTRNALAGRQQVILDYLPMLFHVNHPMLPGYISHQCPAGLSDYKPDKQDVTKLQRLARSFTYQRQANPVSKIHSLVLMGSSGSIGHSGGSDLDIWVCYNPVITAVEHQLLQQKVEAISHWAATLGLEVHFFLMEGEQFRRGQRHHQGIEDCGTSQHFLLLDEFYRTGLLIAGRPPIWWLIPPHEDGNFDEYASVLRHKRFIPRDSTIDFGSVGEIPPGEFIGAGIWQLYKAIDAPYKSVLKLLLTEVYAAEYPQVNPLSMTFKQAVYADENNIDELDPYVMIYRKLESYLLERNEFKRLELVRRCFYFKVGLRLSRSVPHGPSSWQRQLMEKLVAEWEWSYEHLCNLDTRRQWKVGKVIEEQKALVRELTNSYRFLQDFAQRTQTSALINSQEMTILGRKLYAAFERKAGKIEWINPGIADSLTEDDLCFYQTGKQRNGNPVWAVSRERFHKSNDSQPALKQADSLLSLLCWCHYNSIYSPHTRLHVMPGDHQVSEFELHNIARDLSQQLPQANQYSEHSDQQHERFTQAMRTTQILLYLNVGKDPMMTMQQPGVVRLSNRTDSLGYSALRENLVLNIEQVSLNSWGEVSSSYYQGANALIHCLRDYLQTISPVSDQGLPQLQVQCFCPHRAEAIRQRVEELFRDIIGCYYSGTRPSSTRYILEIQREFYILQFIENRPTIECVGSYLSLIHQLGQPQSTFSPIELDRYCLSDSVLAAIAQVSRANSIQVFYQRKGNSAEVVINDEKGSLFSYQTACQHEQELLLPLQQFLQSVLFRRQSESSDLANHYSQSQTTLEFYQLKSMGGKPVAVSITPASNDTEQPTQRYFFNVQAIAQQDQRGQLTFNIYCDQQEFLAMDYGDELFNTVARFILSRRRSNQRYPCYITDLDLSHCNTLSEDGVIQTTHYLRYKKSLERSINQALKRL